jgi:hypothetical protein
MRRSAVLRSLFLTVALLISGMPLAAQDSAASSAENATLVEGPERRRGIEEFAPDLTAYWFGIYELPGGSVTVRYTESLLPQTADWPAAPCAMRTIVTDGADSYRYTASDGGWSVLLTTDGAVDLCGFADQFISRFQFFEGVERRINPSGAPAFPAVVELP